MDDHGHAFPIIDGVPVLLSPERLEVGNDRSEVDLRHPHYAEAYAEMDFYNSGAAENPDMARFLQHIISTSEGTHFPDPPRIWVDAVYDGLSQLECYRHLAPVEDTTMMQLGGSGFHALKMLIGGARHAILVTPMIGEARRAMWLARQVGLENALSLAVGVAEELPIPSSAVNGIFCGGCAHHMHMEAAMKEAARVLAPNGKFAASEPWRAPLYGLGTRLFGKREPNSHCRPFESDRVKPFFNQFSNAKIIHHGTFTRYPMIAFSKARHRPTVTRMLNIFARDDALADRIGLRKFGSSISLLASHEL